MPKGCDINSTEKGHLSSVILRKDGEQEWIKLKEKEEKFKEVVPGSLHIPRE